MKRIMIAILTVLSLNIISMAQNPAPQSTPAPQPQVPQTQLPDRQNPQSTPVGQNQSEQSANPRIAPGSVIPVQLTKSIDAKKIKAGDEVVAKVTQDLKTNTGTLVVPKDTKVVGHVTAAEARTKENKESEIGIAFDHAVLKNGSEMRIPLSVQAVIAPPNANSNSAAGGYDQAAGTPNGQTGVSPSSNGGRGTGMGGNTPAPSAPQESNTSPDAQAATKARPPITGNTQGVVGIPDLKLMTSAPNAAQGSLVSSEKNNVKLESGTFMLLRVNP